MTEPTANIGRTSVALTLQEQHPEAPDTADWAGTTESEHDLHRFTDHLAALCNPAIRTFSSRTTNNPGQRPHRTLRSLEQIDRLGFGYLHRLCPVCAAAPEGAPSQSLASDFRQSLDDLLRRVLRRSVAADATAALDALTAALLAEAAARVAGLQTANDGQLIAATTA